MSAQKPDIREISQEEISDFVKSSGEKPFRLKQLNEWLWIKGAQSFDEMTSLSKAFRDKLNENFSFKTIEIFQEQHSKDKTVKIAFRLFDLSIIEGVLIPSSNRVTACISSQVGCAMNCKFCATGSMGYKRNLSIGEVFDQFTILNKRSIEIYEKPLSNIVVMGMGEPFMNFDNLMFALNKITDPNGLNFSPTRITISTVGVPQGIRDFADSGTKINLAISLHAANESLRNSIIPIGKKFNMNSLRDAIKYYHRKTSMRITYEYILFGGLNDNIEHAMALADFCKISPCKINLIEYNSTSNSQFKTSTPEKRDAFISFLESKNLIVNLRRSKGSDIDAACGQLAGKTKTS
ncbi:MAG: 23S rRNA (adenine(2503)-C(2))-methyltransferase RlmN [Bacteroidales bacterium]|nr:23S rRNA (adenine(2503)-C(2))-methyltransferase RlmN [Bacteroidales bacterium]